MPKASVSVGIIAKNSEKTIGACLDSIVPFVEEVVVCVDVNTTDKTAKVAKEHGAKVFTGLKVSDFHECPIHGKVLAQHFAKARQTCFAKLRTDVDWHMWVDADDVVKGGEKLADYLAKMPEGVNCVWMPYHYATAGQGGPTTTLFDRERLIRTNMPWAWQYRVHEILAPVGIPMEHVGAMRTEAISIWHQGEGHDTAGSAKRNILLLEMDLEENPDDMRAWFYLGNQYFALGDWGYAAQAYERATAAENKFQLWQTFDYLAMSYEKLGSLEGMLNSAMRALEVLPQYAAPYYRLGVYYMLTGDLEKCEFWTQLGDERPDPPFFVFKNPMDKTFNARLTLAQAYQNAGIPMKAKEQLETALQVMPDNEQIKEGIAYSDARINDMETANAFIRVLHNLNGDRLSLPIPESIKRFPQVRDLIVPAMINRQDSQPRIIFWCGRSLEPWAPPSMNTTGIGGSETAVIEIAKRFAADGWRVDVYNDCESMEGIYDGVGYWDCKRMGQGESCDTFVSWRNADAFDLPVSRKVSLLWCHDLNRGPVDPSKLARWDKVLGVSGWHRDYLSSVYGLMGNVDYAPNGISLDRFQGEVKKIPFRCVYASSPDRGLLNLLRMWPDIAQVDPAAELHVAYGWQNIDKSIQMGWDRDGSLQRLKHDCMQMIEATPSVKWRGRLPQDELAKLYQESYAWLYPTQFLEVSCISAMEAMAGGAVPIVSAAGALPETIGEGGAIISGNTYTQAWKDYYVACARGLLQDRTARQDYIAKSKERAQGLSWDAAHGKWKEIVLPLLEEKGEKVEAVI